MSVHNFINGILKMDFQIVKSYLITINFEQFISKLLYPPRFQYLTSSISWNGLSVDIIVWGSLFFLDIKGLGGVWG